MGYKFIVNTNDVNEYKYRVLTEGIDYTQYMKNPVVLFQHERFNNDNKGSEVIGRCIKLYKEGDKLIAEIEFDQEDDFAKKIEGKVDRGFIRMCSIYGDVISSSTDSKDLLPGQVYETVTAMKLVEISITDIGGNDAALKLSRNGAPITLQKLQQIETMSFKTIALAMGLSPDADENAILKEISAVRLAKTDAESKLQELNASIESQQTADAAELVDKAIKLNLIPEALKGAQLAAFKADFSGQKVTLSKLIEEKEAETSKIDKAKLVKDFVGKTKTTETDRTSTEEISFIKLSKENPNELVRIKREEPEEFKRLFKAEYGIEPTL